MRDRPVGPSVGPDAPGARAVRDEETAVRSLASNRFDPERSSELLWLTGIANHVVADFMRDKCHADQCRKFCELDSLCTRELATQSRQSLMVAIVLSQIHPKHREALMARFVHDIKGKALATVLQAPTPDAARRTLRRAVTDFKTTLGYTLSKEQGTLVLPLLREWLSASLPLIESARRGLAPLP